jgi:cell division protease FtsH
VTEAYVRAQEILAQFKARLVEMADALLARETLDAEQVRRIVAGEPLDEPTPATPAASPHVAPPAPKAKERPSIVPPIPPRPVTQE